MIAKRIEINHNPMDKLFRLHKYIRSKYKHGLAQEKKKTVLAQLYLYCAKV